MSSNEYNLNDNVNEDFPFKLGGYHYVMRYPLVEEIEQLQTLIARQQDAKTEEEKTATTKEAQEYMYSFIRPVDEGAPGVTESLKKSNIKVMNNFNNMVQKEFGVK